MKISDRLRVSRLFSNPDSSAPNSGLERNLDAKLCFANSLIDPGYTLGRAKRIGCAPDSCLLFKLN